MLVINTKGQLTRDPTAITDLIHGEAVVVATEIWSDTPVMIAGYLAFHCARKQSGIGPPRGSITIYVRDDLRSFVTPWRDGLQDSDRYTWLHIHHDAGLEKDLYIAGCYFEPRSTGARGNSESLDADFTALGDGMAAAAGLGWVIAAGDFNAHTGNMHQRISQDADRLLNASGHQLLDIAEATGIPIANGKAPGETSGNFTFWNTRNQRSVVDYVLLSPELLQRASLAVEGPPPHEQLDHCAMRLSLASMGSAAQVLDNGHVAVAVMPPMTKLILPQDKIKDYIELLREKAAELAAVLEQAEAAGTPAEVTAALEALTSTITDSAVTVGAKKINSGRARRTDCRAVMRNAIMKDPQVKALVRQRRRARRYGLGQRVRQLDRQICSLKRALEKKKRAETQQRVLHNWRENPAAAWRDLKNMGTTASMHSPGAMQQYCEELLGGTEEQSSVLPDFTIPESLCGDGSTLGEPIQASEVEAAISTLKTGKSVAGTLDLDLIKPVAAELSPVLASIFNAVMRTKEMPTDMALGVITMVPKPRAASMELTDQRTITVCSLLNKIYSNCITRRLNEWGEELQLRADTQTGFRRDHRTMDNVLVLRALTERYRAEAQPLYVAFVDFRKAYDTVPRELLWEKLKKRGVSAEMIDALRAQYASVPLTVKTAAGLTTPFLLMKGLKQGEPSSCDLFTLYVDDIPATVTALGAAAASPKLGGVDIDTLLHADDLALVSTSAEGLQAQLNALAEYSDMWRLTVSISKTKVMVLSQGSMQSSALSVYYKGQELEQVEAFTYLGIRLTSTGDMNEQAAGARLRAGRAAWAAVRGKAAQLGITSVKLLCAYFDAVVRPTLEYGVELWGPAYTAAGADRDGFKPAEKFQRDLMKRLLGVGSKVSNYVALAEVGKFPLKCSWGGAVYGYWRRVLSLPESRVSVKAAVRDNIQLAQQGGSCWAADVIKFMEKMGVASADSNVAPTMAADFVKVAMQQEYLEVYRNATGTKVEFYKNIIRGGDTTGASYTMQQHLGQVMATGRRAALTRFRCSAHRLGVEVGRWAQRPRSTRTCRLCASGAVEDEEHVLLNCSNPSLQLVRSDFSDLVQNPMTLTEFLQQPQRQVAAFVAACLEAGDFESLPMWA
jgi:hypothetical protein